MPPNSAKYRSDLGRGESLLTHSSRGGCVRSLKRQNLHEFPVYQGKYRELSQKPAELLQSNTLEAAETLGF